MTVAALEPRTLVSVLFGLLPRAANPCARRASLSGGGKLLSQFGYDVKHAVRGLLRDRAFTIVALLSIALGAGANSAIFSLVDQALFRRLPVREPQRLALLNWKGTFIGRGWGSGNLQSYPFFRDVNAENQVFDGVFCRFPTSVNLSAGTTPEPVNAEIVSGSYFPVLAIRPAAGRLIGESDDLQPGAHPVVVLSYAYWQARFGGAEDVVGRKVLVNNYPMTVIGVAAAGFHGIDWGEVPSLWVPAMMKRQATPDFDWLFDRRGKWMHVFGRLKPGVTLEQAQAGLQPWFKAMLEADTHREGWPRVGEEQMRRYLASTLELLPASQGRSDLRGRLERPLLMLLAATGFVLLLACLNVASLCLARAFARRREIALRVALGASRGRIIREMLAQSALLAAGGGALGVLLAPAVTRALISFLPNNIDLTAAINPRMLLFTLAVALLTGLLFGLAPAVRASRTELGLALKEQSASVAGGVRLRQAVVIAQIALALVLLIGAGLFVRTLANLRGRGPGFVTTNLLLFRIDLARSGYTRAQSKTMLVRALEALRNAPEVENAGMAMAQILAGGSWNQALTAESGRRVVTDTVHCNAISPGFFATLGAPILAGRDFNERDAHDSPTLGYRSAIVNENFAKRYFGDRNPIGARLGLGEAPDTRTEIEIVGVVKTFTYRGLRVDDDQAFFPLLEGLPRGSGFFVRTRTHSQSAFATVRSVFRQIDPNLPVLMLRTVDDQLDQTLLNERLLAALASAFAALAILLTVVGLYGVISFIVTRRTREIGIRLALGAPRRSAVWLVLRDGAIMVGGGVAIALPVVWALGRLIETQLFGVHAMDGLTIAGAVALVALVALAASALPARRATSVSPMVALRYE
jgi:predicted permease